MENIREIVLDTLMALEKEQEFSSGFIKNVLDKYDYLDNRDKAFMKRVLEGTIERRIELDYQINRLSSVPVKKMKPLIRSLMRMSAYQILYMDSIPDSAVCNEACKLAQKRKFHNLKGFVNAILRKLAKEKEEFGRENLPLPDEKKTPITYLSVKYSMPEFLVELWIEEYGKDTTEKILQGLLDIHPVSVRFVSDLTEKEMEEYQAKWNALGVQLHASRYSEYVFLADHLDNIEELPGFQEGKFTIQDVSSVMSVCAAGIQKTDQILDACAAPGGKSILAAELGKQVISGDVSDRKIFKIQENAMRLGRDNLEAVVHDATEFLPKWEETADVLILDVPCSGLGVIGKKRDIKYNVSPESLESICALQKQIVDQSWRYVKPGGILMYSTCTLHKKENEDMVAYILENFPFEAVEIDSSIPEILQKEKEIVNSQKKELINAVEDCCVTMLPGIMASDGFFFAKLRRK